MTIAEATFIVFLDETRCRGGRACLPVCNYGGLINIPGEKMPMVDPWSCTGCGTCLTVCPEEALTLIPKGRA